MSSTINDGSVEKNLAMSILELENGGLAHFQASFAADDHASDNWTFTIKVIGTKGSTRFSHADWVQNQRAIVLLVPILHTIVLFRTLHGIC